MADSSSSASSSATSPSSSKQELRSSSKTPTQVFRSWARSRGGVSVKDQRRVNLSEALTRFIQGNGGFVTSPPGQRLVRIEIAKDSPLPVKLAEMGYEPILCGQTMRTVSSGFVQVDIIEISLERMAASRDEL